jgi:hypothetical protein
MIIPMIPGIAQTVKRYLTIDRDCCCVDSINPIGIKATRQVNLIEQQMPPKKKAIDAGIIVERFFSFPSNSCWGHHIIL